MANYANLKAQIDANIYQNDQSAISGAVMNTQLKAMVDALGDGYQFMGVATPSTNPGSPDAKVFYIATQPGTYTNFGNTTIQQGQLGVFMYSSSWSYSVTWIMRVIDTLRSMGADRALSAHQGTLIGNSVYGNFTRDTSLNSSGQEVSDPGRGVSNYIEVEPSRSYTWFSAYGSSTVYAVIFDADYVQLDRISNSYAGKTFTTGATAKYVRITINEAYLTDAYLKDNVTNEIIWRPDFGAVFKADKSTSDLNDTMPKVERLIDRIFGDEISVDNAYLNSDGTTTENNDYAISKAIPIREKRTIAVVNLGTVLTVAKVLEYNANGSVVNATSLVSNSYAIINPTANTSYIKVSFKKSVQARMAYTDPVLVLWEHFPDTFDERYIKHSEIDISHIFYDNSDVFKSFRYALFGGKYQDGVYLNSSGATVEGAGSCVSDFIPIQSGSTYRFYHGFSSATLYNNAKIVFYDTNKVRIDNASLSSQQYWQGTITAAYVRVSCSNVSKVNPVLYLIADGVESALIWQRDYGVQKVSDEADALIETANMDVRLTKDSVYGSHFKDGYYLNSSGAEVEDAASGISDFIPIKSNTAYKYIAVGMGSFPYSSAKVCVYDKNKTLITYYSIPSNLNVSISAAAFQQGAAFLRVSYPLAATSAEVRLSASPNTLIWSLTTGLISQTAKNTTDIARLSDRYTELSDTIVDAINAFRSKVAKALKDNALTFGWVTDVHLSESATVRDLKRLYTLAKTSQSSALKFLVFGGDLVSGASTIADDMRLMAFGKVALVNNFGHEVFMIRGNHDGGHVTWKSVVDGGGTPTDDDIVTNKEWYNMLVKNDNVVYDSANPMGGYYYKDFADEKVRAIFLNMYDWDGSDSDGVYNAMYNRACIDNNQAKWLAQTALDFSSKGEDKSNWSVVLFSHDGIQPDNGNFDNSAQIVGILSAFVTGGTYAYYYARASKPTIPAMTFTADYTSQGAIPVKALIHGHTHTDRVIFSGAGYPCISTAADHPDSSENLPAGATLPLPRVNGQVNEYCWDAVAVGENEINLYRFGAVEQGKTSGDRKVHLGMEEVSVGNTITLISSLTGTLTWGIYSVSSGYYVPIVDGVAGTPVGTPTNHASISNGVVTGLSVGGATAFAQDEAGNKEFWGIKVN